MGHAVKLASIGFWSLPLLASCATLTPVQQESLAEVRRLVADTARIYGVRPLYVIVGEHMAGIAAEYRPGHLLISPQVLAYEDYDALVAHELGHYLLGHGSGSSSFSGPATPGDWQREQELRELDANAKAVEILVRVRGWPERAALRAVYDWLLRRHRVAVRGSRPPTPGHRSPCEEIKDLLSRFVEQRAWTTGLECS